MVVATAGTGEAAWKVSAPGSLEEMVQYAFAGSRWSHREGGDHPGVAAAREASVSPGVQ